MVPAWVPTLLFSAAIFVPGHLFGWLLEWLWLVATLFFGGFFVLNGRVSGTLVGIPLGIWLCIFGFLTILSVISLGAALVLHGIPIETRDIFEMIRFPVYAALGVIVAKSSENWRMQGFDRVLKFLGWYVLACSAVYIMEIPVIYSFLENFIYKGSKNLIGLGVIRISFPFENPNFLGFFLIFCIGYFSFFKTSAMYFCIYMALLFLTGSRSALIAVIPILFFGFLFYIFKFSTKEIGVRTFITWAGPAILLSFIVMFWDKITYFSRILELVNALQGSEIGNVKTADIRFETAGHLLMWFERSPLIGWGPGRALLLDVADNQYMSWLVNWGILGAAAMSSTVLMLFYNIISSAKSYNYLFGSLSIMLSVIIMIFTGDFLENYRLFFLMIMFLQALYVFVIGSSNCSSKAAQGCQDGH